MLSSLHPLCLLTRTDAELTTLFHSFYLIEYLPDVGDTRVVQRFPQDKPHIDTIESGLKLFIINGVGQANTIETTGKFVVTSSDSSRYFAFYRSFETKVLVAVSSLPTMSFSRELFDLLRYEPVENIPPILLTLCEVPVMPAPGMQYDIGLSEGTASLKFSAVEQVEDADIDFIVLSVMSPMMLVKAWESIVLEKKVLVVSNCDAITTACCEFLRRMVSPLVMVNSFVPLLPPQIIDTVDAPFPYLLGANTRLLKDNINDLSDTVVVDLDTRTVHPRVSKSGRPEVHASVHMISRLAQELNEIMLNPLGDWFQRPSTAHSDPLSSPFSEASYTARCTKILNVFKRTNLELMSARNCTVRAFWRRSFETAMLQTATTSATVGAGTVHSASDSKSVTPPPPPPPSARKGGNMMGFNYLDGVCSGFMQLAKELHDENDLISHFTPCWVEMDQFVLSVYQHADDLPILYILLKDIETVSPCAIEPEGHVFEMVVKDHSSYRFTVTDTDARQKWISTIDRRKTMDFSGYNDDQAFLDLNYSNKVRINDIELTNVADSGQSVTGTMGGSTNAGGSNNLIGLWNGYEVLYKARDGSDGGITGTALGGAATAANPYGAGAIGGQGMGGAAGTGNNIGGGFSDDSNNGATSASVGSTVTLGLPQPCPPIYTEALAMQAKEDTMFRFEFSRTQTMNFIQQKVECSDFLEIFRSMKIKAESLLGSTYSLDSNSNVVLTAQLHAASDNNQSEEDGAGLVRANSEGTGFATEVSSVSGRNGDSSRKGPDSSAPTPSQQASMLQRTHTSSGFFSSSQSSQASSQHSSKRLSSKMFSGFFQKKPSLEDELAACARAEQEREQELEAQRQRQIIERKRAALQSQIFVVTATYRRTQAELNALIVESRQKALQDLVIAHAQNLATGTAPSPFAIVQYPMKNILASLRRAAPPPKGARSPTRKASPPPPNAVPPITTGTAVNAAAAAAQAASAAWMEHIWLSLIGKSYEEYRRDNPPPSANANGNGADGDDGEPELRLSNSEIDEFILDAHRAKTEKDERKQIRELILAYIGRHHDLNSQNKSYSPYGVIRTVLMGYLHESLHNSSTALEFYARGGSLIEQRRLMSCLVHQFLGHIDKQALMRTQSEPSSPGQVASAAAQAPHPMHALNHLLNSYVRQPGTAHLSPVHHFLETSKAVSPLVGMQAYRLVLELIYRDLVCQLDAVADKDHNGQLHKDLELGSFRTFPGSHRNVSTAHQTSARSRVKTSTLLNTDFEFTAGDPKSEAINNAVTCVAIKVERTPCDLSVLLLTELKEIIKTYCQSPAGAKNSKKTTHTFCKMKLTATALEELSATSAYKAFEQHCCILQKVEPRGMSINERVLFWVNIYNTITVHAIMNKISPGTTLLERSAFMRSTKYNIGGVMHSLLDIEHGILRHASSKPMLFGPLSVNLSFAERDPRRKQILEEPRPNISFVLCTACITSPSLVVLKDPDMVNDEIKYYSRRFFHEYVKMDAANKTITLPALMRIYWADFGGNRAKVLRTIAQLSGSQFAAEMKPYMSPLEGIRAKVEFAKYDWAPILSIGD